MDCGQTREKTIGFLIGLPVAFTLYQGNPTKALWSSIFTSVSAFNIHHKSIDTSKHYIGDKEERKQAAAAAAGTMFS